MVFSSDSSSDMMGEMERVYQKMTAAAPSTTPPDGGGGFFSSQDDSSLGGGGGESSHGKENACSSSPRKQKATTPTKDPWDEEDEDDALFPTEDAIDAMLRQHEQQVQALPLHESSNRTANIPRSIQVPPSGAHHNAAASSSYWSDLDGFEGLLDESDSFLLEMDRSLLEDDAIASPPSPPPEEEAEAIMPSTLSSTSHRFDAQKKVEEHVNLPKKHPENSDEEEPLSSTTMQRAGLSTQRNALADDETTSTTLSRHDERRRNNRRFANPYILDDVSSVDSSETTSFAPQCTTHATSASDRVRAKKHPDDVSLESEASRRSVPGTHFSAASNHKRTKNPNVLDDVSLGSETSSPVQQPCGSHTKTSVSRPTTKKVKPQRPAFSPDSSSSEEENVDTEQHQAPSTSAFFPSPDGIPAFGSASVSTTQSPPKTKSSTPRVAAAGATESSRHASLQTHTTKSATPASNHHGTTTHGSLSAPPVNSTASEVHAEDKPKEFVFVEPSTCDAEYEFCDPTTSNNYSPPRHQQALDAFGFPLDPEEEELDDEVKDLHNDPATELPQAPSAEQEHEPSQPAQEQADTDPSGGRPSEIDASQYPPQPRIYEQPPIVHTFDARSRPPVSRVSVPVAQVFDSRVGGLWRNKFDTFNHLQSELANMVAYSDDNVVCSAPTGAGKTALFEMALARFFAVDLQTPGGPSGKVSNRRKAVYVSPSKALCEERYDDWSRRFTAMNLGVQVAVITGDGDPSESFHDLASAHFVLTTPEKWESLTRRWTENFFLFASVKIFLVDEVHLIADENRGCCLESIVSRMKIIQQTARRVDVTEEELSKSSYKMTSPEAIGSPLRFVAVSATLPNIAEIAQFFDANECHVFDKTYRPVPLQIHVIGQGTLGGRSGSEFHFARNLDRNVPDIVAKFSSGRPTIVFCHSKNDTEKLADILATARNIGNRTRTTAEIASRTRISKLQRVLLHGIAYHHAGLDLDDRRVVEQAFKEGQIRVLCATSTLAMGVNLPAHLVVVKGTRAWRGTVSGYQNIDQASLLQMIGRAGRPGFDTSGTVVIMTDNESKQKFQSLASSGLEPATSKCIDDRFVETMNAEISQRVVTSMATAIEWVKGTLLFVQMMSSATGPAHGIDANLNDLCKIAFSKLELIGAIVVRGDFVYPLAACHVMSHNLVDYPTMLQISQLPFDANQCQLLKSLSMIEGLQRPLRRSEKKSLNAAHKDVPHKLEGVPSKVRVKEPWEKAFVLFQVYIAELALEGNDFTLRQEMRSMVDFASRMLSAVEEYSTKGTRNGNVALQSLRLRRSLAVKLWCGRSGTLKQINGVSKALAFQLSNHGISTFEDVVKNSNEKIEQAAGRSSPFGKDLRDAAERILLSSLTISGALETAHEPTTPGTLVCKIQRRPVEGLSRSEKRNSTVHYTLFVYTDQEGGCLLVEENITGPCEFTTAVPLKYGKIFLRLIGSVVGVDDAMEISGNGNFATSLGADRGPAPRIRNTGKKYTNRNAPTSKRRKQAPTERSQLTLTEMSQRAKLRKTSKATVTPPREAPASPPIAAADRIEREDLYASQSDTLYRAAGQRRQAQNGLGGPPQYSENVRPTSNRANAWIPQPSVSSHRGHPIAPVQAEAHNTPPPPNRSFHQKRATQQLPSTESRSSWKKAKLQQERSQRRAFVRKRDNPFALYSHDPNNAESALEQLASQTDDAAQSSIIPQEMLRQTNVSQFQRATFQRRQPGRNKRLDERPTTRRQPPTNGGYQQPGADGLSYEPNSNVHPGDIGATYENHSQRSSFGSSEVPHASYHVRIPQSMVPIQIRPTSSYTQQQPFCCHRHPHHHAPTDGGEYHPQDTWRDNHPQTSTVQYHAGPAMPQPPPVYHPVTQSPHHGGYWHDVQDGHSYPPSHQDPRTQGFATTQAQIDYHYQDARAGPPQLAPSGWENTAQQEKDNPQYFHPFGIHGMAQEEFESAFF